MARYRLSGLAKADIVTILKSSEARHGRQARLRYRGLLTLAMRRISSEPEGHATFDRAELLPGVRSYHIRHSRVENRNMRVVNPVHVIFYRSLGPGLIEIVRVPHERMDPGRHIGPDP